MTIEYFNSDGQHYLAAVNEEQVKISDIFLNKESKLHPKHHKNLDNYYWQMDQLTVPSINNNKIKNLKLKPGKSPHFILFFMISCYIPIITAVIGPLSHMFSIACLVNKWMMTKNTRNGVKDNSLIVVLNCVSLFVGGVSNITLLLHFSDKISYLRAQLVNITGWGFAGTILLVDIIIFRSVEFDHSTYSKDIGFWYAVYTCIMYFFCSILLMIHLLGYKLGKYKPTFNLSEDEKAVMLYTFLLFLWISWGSWLYSKILFDDRSYGVSMYALLCGALTVGFGDIYSSKVAGKIVSMIYFLCSIIIIALIITMTSQIIKNTFRSTIHLHLCEKARIEAVEKHEITSLKYISESNNSTTIEKDYSNSASSSFAYETYLNGNNYTDVVEFIEMRKLHFHYKRFSKRLGFITSVSLFLVFWLFGAMIFKFCEEWSYFDSMYFAFLDCLLTIGYGDFILQSGSGRAFFVLFALAAIPLMTSLINSIGDSLSTIGWSFVKYSIVAAKYTYEICGFILIKFLKLVNLYSFTKKIMVHTPSRTFSNKILPFQLTSDKAKQLKDDLDDLIELGFEINFIQDDDFKDNFEYDWIDQVMRLTKDYELLSHISPKFKLSYQEWLDFFKLSYHENQTVINTRHFWLSEESPIRFDTNEPRFMYLQLSYLLRQHLNRKKNQLIKVRSPQINPNLLGRNVLDIRNPYTPEINTEFEESGNKNCDDEN
ncbi:hypothetical protein QEN19_003150 [Hanseniaspora menglaensis]